MGSNALAKIYLALEENEVEWKEGLKEEYDRHGEVGDYEEGVVTRVINYDSQDSYCCGIELESVEWGCKEIDLHVINDSANEARRLLSYYVNNPEDFKLTLSAEYF